MRKENLTVTDSTRLLDDLRQEGERVRGLNRLDVVDAEKRLSRILKTPEGKEAFRRVTGLREALFADDAQERHEPEKLPIVAILMPSYRLPAPQAWEGINKLMRASMNVCQPFMEPTIRQSIVHWTRNYALSLLNKTMKPWDYVLFVDDDIEIPLDGLGKMLAHKVDVVAAACTVRVDPPMPNFRVYDPATHFFSTCLDWDREGLIGGMDFGVGTGAILLSRNVLERVAEYYINCKYEQKFYGLTGEALDKLQTGRQKKAKETGDFWWFEFLKHPDGAGEYGEDISFCFKCRELGIPVHVDTTIRPKHYGDYGYNLDDYCDIRESHRVQLEAKGGKSMQSPVTSNQLPESKISILVPTRGRPENVNRLLDSISRTAASPALPEVVLYVDDDDASAAAINLQCRYAPVNLKIVTGPRRCLSECWNECAKVATGDILMHGGDDITFNTPGWDTMVRAEFAKYPDKLIFVHGDDLYWGEKFGTHGFLHRRWLDIAGYFCPPYFSSDYNDTWFNDVFNAIGRRVFLPFVTEHHHPMFKKAEWDQTHQDRLARHKKDNVDQLYKDLRVQRAADAAKVRLRMGTPYEVGNPDSDPTEACPVVGGMPAATLATT